MQIRNTLPYVGTFLKVNALILAAPLPIANYYGEALTPLLVAAAASYLCGVLLTRTKHEEIKYSETVILSALILLAISVFGAIPFYMQFNGHVFERTVDSFFESVSGYTTTGLSVINDVGSTPKSLIFLRAVYQWVGGIGIVVLSFSALMHGATSFFLYREEQESNRILPSVAQSAKLIIMIYVIYTVIGSVLLMLAGVSPYASVSGMFATLSTGGFSTGDVLYPNYFAKAVFIVFMLAGSMAFAVHHSLFKGDIRGVLENIQFKLIIGFILAGIMAFTIVLHANGEPWSSALDKSVFNVVSAQTTTGFSDIDFSQLSDLGKFLTSMMMAVGGGMGSTSGGLKIFRVYVLARAVVWFIKKNMSPSTAVIPLKIDGKPFHLEEVNLIILFFFAFMLILVSGIVVLSAYGYSGIDSLFLSSSAVGTVGLSTIDVASLPLVPKLVLIMEMIFGRVEIVSLAALLGHLLVKVNKSLPLGR